MIASAVLCYGAAALTVALAIVGTVLFFKKTQRRFSLLHAVIGAVSFAAVTAGMFALMLYSFSEDATDYMSAIMPEGLYKISVAVLYFAAVAALRYFILNGVYFNRCRADDGISFLAGYGIGAGAALLLYCLAMLVYIVISAAAYGYTGMSDGGALLFGNGERISVMLPFYGHIFAAGIFAAYAWLMLTYGVFADRHASLPYTGKRTAAVLVLLILCEIIMICSVLFHTSERGLIWVFAVCALSAAAAFAAVLKLYKYKKALPYEQQFE